jgi:hypothetical protein
VKSKFRVHVKVAPHGLGVGKEFFRLLEKIVCHLHLILLKIIVIALFYSISMEDHL